MHARSNTNDIYYKMENYFAKTYKSRGHLLNHLGRLFGWHGMIFHLWLGGIVIPCSVTSTKNLSNNFASFSLCWPFQFCLESQVASNILFILPILPCVYCLFHPYVFSLLHVFSIFCEVETKIYLRCHLFINIIINQKVTSVQSKITISADYYPVCRWYAWI